MVEYQRKQSSGISKAALATAIGAGVVSLSNGNGLSGIAPGLFGQRNAFAAAEVVNGGFVTEKEMKYISESNSKDAIIARLEAEKYADRTVTAALAPVYVELNKQKDEICTLKSALAMETERRSCGDENLLTYVNGNFIKAEKSLNSCHINYHGVKPVIRPVNNDCCECN